MTDKTPKIPTKEGLKQARELVRKQREKQPSERLIRIVDEVTRENVPDVSERDIAAKPTEKSSPL